MKPNTKWIMLFLVWAVFIGYFLIFDVLAPKSLEPKPSQPPPSKVTKANYDKIQLGMSLEDVEELIGQHTAIKPSDGPNEIYVWKTGVSKAVTITFDKNRVIAKRAVGIQ